MFPEKLLRGIPDKNFLTEERRASANLFHFKEVLGERRQNAVVREDGYYEESINWYDNEEAVKYLLAQTREEGGLKYKEGAAVISKEGIDRIRILPEVNHRLSYERNAVEGNSFHGNLLLRRETSKPTMKMIAGAIALCVEEIITI
jgi:hypothetical protein